MGGEDDRGPVVGQGKVTLGSRAAAEHATYFIEATDGGIGGGKAGDAFAFTAFFAPKRRR